jgi:ElaB/YqjD/DUF883 family membrane-anchored ribosome-binding protein
VKAVEARLAEEKAAVMTKTKAAAKAADNHVRAHAWTAVGIAVAFGLVLGILAARR